jgi:hypothetical protein
MVMPSWQADRYSRQRGPAPALLAHLLHTALARADKGELCSDEEAVCCHQHGDCEEEKQLGHLRPEAAGEVLLRGSSSSLIGGRSRD